VQRDLQVWDVFARLAREVAVHGAQHRLVSDHEQWLGESFQLGDDGIETLDHVQVRLAAGVAVPQFVSLAGGEFVGHLLADLVIGQAVAHAGVDLFEGSPLHVGSA